MPGMTDSIREDGGTEACGQREPAIIRRTSCGVGGEGVIGCRDGDRTACNQSRGAQKQTILTSIHAHLIVLEAGRRRIEVYSCSACEATQGWSSRCGARSVAMLSLKEFRCAWF